ncbi:MAG: hypothetical protein OXU75_06450 [Deltaproteobacteria bacterium]|nr:hypothetical protein [Deltaproteobacteria bacterium]
MTSPRRDTCADRVTDFLALLDNGAAYADDARQADCYLDDTAFNKTNEAMARLQHAIAAWRRG